MTIDAYDLVQSSLLGDAVEHAPVGVLVADEDMRYLAVNRYACELLGYERSDLMRRRVSDVSKFAGSEEHWSEMLSREALSGRSTVVRKDGSDLAVDYFAGATQLANMQVYVTFIRPAGDEPV